MASVVFNDQDIKIHVSNCVYLILKPSSIHESSSEQFHQFSSLRIVTNHLMEQLFNLSEVQRVVEEYNYEIIALQFPDELISYSVEVYAVLRSKLRSEVTLFIAVDSTYGSSVDDVSAMHVDSQLLVYFGDDLSSSG